jgi:hypothetical protein
MSTETNDLWPSDIAANSNLRTPVTILKEQAALLGQKTDNLVIATVSSGNTNNSCPSLE